MKDERKNFLLLVCSDAKVKNVFQFLCISAKIFFRCVYLRFKPLKLFCPINIPKTK